MADVTLVKTAEGLLVAADPASQERVQGWPVGALFKAKVTRMRNPQFHRKGMALLRFAYENCDLDAVLGEPVGFDTFRKVVALKTEWCDTVLTADGGIARFPKSMAFNAMDEDEFTEWYSDAIDFCLRLLPEGSTRETVERGILEFV